jgi:ubiquinone/menaquinone biosynthesis C-methylase UbiE
MMVALERFFPTSRAWVCGRAEGRTLEVGIGTGLNLPHYPSGLDVVGLDPDGRMLDGARRRAADLGHPVTLVEGDAMVLPFPDAAFDSVVCTFVLCGVPDDRAALGEMVRVLKPSGSLLLADHVVAASWPVRWLERLVELVTVPTHGEHFTRRPLLHARAMELEIVETERLTYGAIEHVHATRAISTV